MAIELKQNLKLAQQLVMTPQLQQAIKLLQLSRLELLELIREEMKENPILEEGSDNSAEKTNQEAQIADELGSSREEKDDFKEESKEADFDWRDYLYEEAKTSWDPLSRRGSGNDETRQSIERNPDKKGGLQEHLLEQLALSDLDLEEKECGALIIGNLDSNGYLAASLEELSSLSDLNIDTVETVLKEIQKFDPSGVAARNLQECLMLQVAHLNNSHKALIEQILTHQITNLGSKKYNCVAKALNVSKEDVIKAVRIIIYSLEPKPGRAFNREDPHYITPDIFVYKIEGDYIVVLNEDGMPKLHINSFYQKVLADKNTVQDASKEYIQNKLRSAVWFIKSIYHRQNTVRNVMYSIIKFQRPFFDKGISQLKPLVLRDVAEDIDMHESTVSRVTNNKYVHTPHGIFELKFFFNSSINSLHGDNVASESVKDLIRKIISQEDSKSPYSDQEMVKILKTKNVSIARRTVTKYREMMSILPSNKRKKLF